MINLLQMADYDTETHFENVPSKNHLEWILKSYVDSINKDAEEIGRY